MRKPEREVHRILEYSLQFVRQRLVESGCEFEKGNLRANAPVRRRRARSQV
jgi:hypothetical protein